MCSCVTCKLAKAVFSAVTVYSTPDFPSSHWSAAPLIVTSANWPSSVWKIEARRHPISFRPVLLDWIRSDKTGCMGLINLCTFCHRFYLLFTGFSQLTEHLLQVQSSFHWATVVMCKTFGYQYRLVSTPVGCGGYFPHLIVSSAVRSFFRMIKSLAKLVFPAAWSCICLVTLVIKL